MNMVVQTPGNPASGGGGGFTPTCFQATKNTAIQGTTTSYDDITNYDEDINQGSDYTFVGTTGILTFDTAGTYQISFWAMGAQSANNRHELQVRMLKDIGSGFVVTGVESAQDKQYASRSTTQDEGSAQINGYLLEADAGDAIKFQFSHVGVAANFGENDVRISVVKVSNTGRT